jgi:glycosyltransferase involved in cell wall biosynthesis
MSEMPIPFFSVILPTYNRAHSIANAIKSLLIQDFKNWELIIIDDGSTDNTKEVVEKFNDLRIKYHYQNNTERSVARNNGFKVSKGNYICFLDSDDEYCANHLSAFYNFLESNGFPKAMIFSNAMVIKDGICYNEPTAKLELGDPLGYILQNSIIPDRVCLHADILKDYQFSPLVNIGEDAILWAQLTSKYPLLHLNETTIMYHVHDDNSVNLKNNVYKSRLIGLRQLFKEKPIKKRLSSKIKNEIISVCHYGMARHYELKRRFLPMVIHSILSIIYDLKSPQNKAKLYMIYNFFRKA